jgi:hypothetical protein
MFGEGTSVESVITRWAIIALGAALAVVASGWPWFTARGVAGSAAMAGWGVWTTSGALDASLRPLPLALLVYAAVAAMVYGAVRGAFGIAVVGAMAAFGVGVLPFMLMPATTRESSGAEAVGIAVGTGPILVIAVSLVAAAVCWIGYARCVLRAAPRAEA